MHKLVRPDLKSLSFPSSNFDEDEIRSSATSSNEALSEETRNRLRHILPMLEKNIADLVQDTDSM